MQRFPDWPQRLSRAVHLKRDALYAWGENDCALCAADLVAAQTGQDFGAPFRGRYSDEAGARRVLAALGHADLAELVATCLVEGEGRPRRGDVVLHPGPDGDFLTVAFGGGLVGPGPNGLAWLQSVPGARFWRVG